MNKVKNYTDSQLLKKAKSLESFEKIPKDYWILGVQSLEDTFNVFDDKFYLFKGEEFIFVCSGTANAGAVALKNFETYNKKGAAVIKTNEWYYNIWKPGLHKGRMRALVQVSPVKYYRDYNKNNNVEELGEVHYGIIGMNFHTVSYNMVLDFWKKLIGYSSLGCQVVNHVGKYYHILDLVENQKRITYCLIKEF